MFNYLLHMDGAVWSYGNPMLAAISSAVCKVNGRIVSCDQMFGFIKPFLIVLAPFVFFLILIAIASCILMIISWWKIYEKAGRPGWIALIPVYNIVVLLEIVRMQPLLILVMFIPLLGPLALFVVMIFVYIKLSKAFGKDEGFSVGLILLPFVFAPILAFGQSKFDGSKIPSTT